MKDIWVRGEGKEMGERWGGEGRERGERWARDGREMGESRQRGGGAMGDRQEREGRDGEESTRPGGRRVEGTPDRDWVRAT